MINDCSVAQLIKNVECHHRLNSSVALIVSPARFSGGDIKGSLLSSCGVGGGVTKKFLSQFSLEPHRPAS